MNDQKAIQKHKQEIADATQQIYPSLKQKEQTFLSNAMYKLFHERFNHGIFARKMMKIEKPQELSTTHRYMLRSNS